jgi:hypothetical protein
VGKGLPRLPTRLGSLGSSMNYSSRSMNIESVGRREALFTAINGSCFNGRRGWERDYQDCRSDKAGIVGLINEGLITGCTVRY